MSPNQTSIQKIKAMSNISNSKIILTAIYKTREHKKSFTKLLINMLKKNDIKFEIKHNVIPSGESYSKFSIIRLKHYIIKLEPYYIHKEMIDKNLYRSNNRFLIDDTNMESMCKSIVNGEIHDYNILPDDNDEFEDAAIRAPIAASISRNDILRTYKNRGLIAVFNMGMWCMWVYMQAKNNKK